MGSQNQPQIDKIIKDWTPRLPFLYPQVPQDRPMVPQEAPGMPNYFWSEPNNRFRISGLTTMRQNYISATVQKRANVSTEKTGNDPKLPKLWVNCPGSPALGHLPWVTKRDASTHSFFTLTLSSPQTFVQFGDWVSAQSWGQSRGGAWCSDRRRQLWPRGRGHH